MFEPNAQVPWGTLDKIVGNLKNIEKKTMWDVVREIFEATYYNYGMKWHAERAEVERLSNVVIDKVTEITNLEHEVIRLLNLLQENGVNEESRISIPEASQKAFGKLT